MNPLLHARRVSKRFPGVLALDKVELTVFPGEVLALVGENGAGKSSLMKILSGVEQPTSGEILVEGKPVKIDSVQSALRLGIALIHQELCLCDNLDVATNLFLGREPTRWGLLHRSRILAESRRLLDRVGLDVNPRKIVRSLTIGQQQLVEIARALSVGARIIIMDEPTSSLSQHETETLFEVVKDLRRSGVSIIYISHRLAEVQELADRVCVLRDGRNAGELSRDKISHDTLVQMMVGRELSRFYSRKQHALGEVVLDVNGLATQSWPRHRISFQVRSGEIVCLAGLVGAGRSEVLRAVFGIDPAITGTVAIEGKQMHIKKPADAIQCGIAFVPENRKTEGLIVESSVAANIGLAGLHRFRRGPCFVNARKMSQDSSQMIERLGIKTPHANQVVQFLSGGNQQKVVVAKWLTMNPKVLLLDEPTRGIDIGAKQEIYSLMEQLAAQGAAILFASSEMEEVLGMSDRVLVMCEGALTGQLSREQLSEQAIMHLATTRLSSKTA